MFDLWFLVQYGFYTSFDNSGASLVHIIEFCGREVLATFCALVPYIHQEKQIFLFLI